MDYLAIGGLLITVCLVITIIGYKRLNECNAMNTYGLIMIAFIIATLCLAAVMSHDYVDAVEAGEEGLSQVERLGRCAVLFGSGMAISLVAAFARYHRADIGSGRGAASE